MDKGPNLIRHLAYKNLIKIYHEKLGERVKCLNPEIGKKSTLERNLPYVILSVCTLKQNLLYVILSVCFKGTCTMTYR